MAASAGDPALLHHYTVAIFPFRHDQEGRFAPGWLAELQPRWAPWWTRLGAELEATLEATSFFLPYIRALLYPEVARLQEETGIEDHFAWARRLRHWCAGSLPAFARDMPPGSVLHLTARPPLATALRTFSLAGPGDDPDDLQAALDWADALLFPSGLGFLLFKVRLAGAEPRLAQLIHLNRVVRLVQPPRHRAELPLLHLADGAALSMRDLVNDLVRGLAVPWDVAEEERLVFPAPVHPEAVPYTDSPQGRDLGERCHLLSYACAELADLPPGELPPGPFPSGTERVLFEYAACIALGDTVHDPVWVPSAEQAHKLSAQNSIRLWRCWSGMVLKEALVFLGTEDLAFNRRSLPRRIENEYLPLYLYTLYQKLQLFTFSTDLMQEVARSSLGHPGGARALLQRFVTFRAQYWFDEVTRKPQGSELYRTFQQGLGVPGLYALVTNSVKEVKEYYEGVWARQVQWVRDVLTYGGPATVAVGAVRMFLGNPGTGEWTVAGLLLALLAGALVLFLGWRRGRGVRRGAVLARAGGRLRSLRLRRLLGRPAGSAAPRP